MCTAIMIKSKHSFFGRNMDIDYSFNEKIINIFRGYKIEFKIEEPIINKYSILGIGTIIDGYPMYADAMNECGLAIAGLAFVNNCTYYNIDKNKMNYAPYELPLIILSTCRNIDDVKNILKKINIIDYPFSKDVPVAPLHFIVSDKESTIVIETLKDGMNIYDNPYNLLTNNPPFYFHKENLSNYLQLHNGEPINLINNSLKIEHYSYNQGAIGLPGDFSSTSRFIKCFYVKSNLILDGSDNDIIDFFKCLDSVSMVKGSVKTSSGYEITSYTSCYDLSEKKLYYKTYNDGTIKSSFIISNKGIYTKTLK